MQDYVKFPWLNISRFWYSREHSGKWMHAEKNLIYGTLKARVYLGCLHRECEQCAVYTELQKVIPNADCDNFSCSCFSFPNIPPTLRLSPFHSSGHCILLTPCNILPRVQYKGIYIHFLCSYLREESVFKIETIWLYREILIWAKTHFNYQPTYMYRYCRDQK